MPPAKCLCGSIFWDFIHFRACFLQFCVLFTLSSLHLVWVSQLNSVRTDGRLPAGGSDSGSEVGSGTGSGRALREMHRGWRRCRGSPGPWFLVFFLSLFLPLLRNGWLLGWTGLDGLDWMDWTGWTGLDGLDWMDWTGWTGLDWTGGMDQKPDFLFSSDFCDM